MVTALRNASSSQSSRTTRRRTQSAGPRQLRRSLVGERLPGVGRIPWHNRCRTRSWQPREAASCPPRPKLRRDQVATRPNRTTRRGQRRMCTTVPRVARTATTRSSSRLGTLGSKRSHVGTAADRGGAGTGRHPKRRPRANPADRRSPVGGGPVQERFLGFQPIAVPAGDRRAGAFAGKPMPPSCLVIGPR